jgi:hypothetical protein
MVVEGFEYPRPQFFAALIRTALAVIVLEAALTECAASRAPSVTTVEVTAPPGSASAGLSAPTPSPGGPQDDKTATVSVGDTNIRYVVGSAEATAAIMKVVRAALSRARACYDAGVTKNAGLRGRVIVQIELGPKGELRSVRDTESALADRDVVECVLHAFATSSFDEIDGRVTGDVQIVQRMDFQPRR